MNVKGFRMNEITKKLSVNKIRDYRSKDITKDALLKDDEILFIKDIIEREVPVLVIYDRDTDGTTGMAGGVHASNEGVLPKSWNHSYSWGKTPGEEGGSSGTFGASSEQILEFFKKNDLDDNAEVVVFTVDNGSSCENTIIETKKVHPNVKFFITDHHLSNDKSREVADFFLNPSDDFDKGLSDWVVFEDNENSVTEESHESGGMLWNLILREIKFHKSNTDPDKKPKHQLTLDNPDDFHMRTGLMSQWCDMITYAADFEESFRVNLKNGNLQKLPIFKYVKSLEWSGMTDENWETSFREKIRKVSSIANTTKRLDFLLSSNDFETSINEMAIDTSSLDKKYDGSLVETFKKWNAIVKKEIQDNHPSIEVGDITYLKYAYLFNIIEGNSEITEIIAELADIKNKLMRLNDYQKQSKESVQFFFTKNPTMRGITSISGFIEKDRPTLFNMSPDDFNDGIITLKGSYRSESEGLFEFLNNETFDNGSIKLQGHSKAAGVTIKCKEDEIDNFYTEIDEKVTSFLEKVNFKEEELVEISYQDVKQSVKEVISNQNYYVFSDKMEFKMKLSDIIDSSNSEIKVSKKGSKYVSGKDFRNNISVLGFNMDNVKDDDFVDVEISVIPNRNKPMIQINIGDVVPPIDKPIQKTQKVKNEKNK
jgi:hypothetical protein